MRKLLFYCLLAALCPAGSNAEPNNMRALAVGDTVPNLQFTNMGNYKANKANLSDFGDQLVILDFWSTWCGSCMDAMPHMQDLQQQFAGLLQVILVNTYVDDSLPRVEQIFQKREKRAGKKITLLYSLQQTLLHVYFPHVSIPHYVWIRQGKVVGITGKEDVSEENILSFIEGQIPTLKLKQDLMTFDEQMPLFKEGNGGDGSSYLSRTIWSKKIDGVNPVSGVGRFNDDSVNRLYMYNHTLQYMLSEAYPFLHIFQPARIIIQLPDTRNLLPNTYCYEAIFPPAAMEKAKVFLQEDLRRQFSITVTKDTVDKACLVLYQGNIMAKPPGEKKARQSVLHKNGDIILQNYKVEKLIPYLERLNIPGMPPIENMTGLTNTVSIRLPENPDLKTLTRSLRDAGFEVREETRKIEMAVIRYEP